MRTIFNVVVILLVGLFVSGAVGNFIDSRSNSGNTGEATNTTMRNAFVSACKQEFSGYGNYDNNIYCQCAFDELMDMYPDFLTNNQRIERINTSGYNSQETDQLVTCLPKAERKNV